MYRKAIIVSVLIASVLSTNLAAQSDLDKAPKLMEEMNALVAKAKTEDITDLKVLHSRLAAVLKSLEANTSRSVEEEGLVDELRAVVLVGGEKITKLEEAPTIQDLIKGAKPMTAVLFSTDLERSAFEVVKDPSSMDPAMGLVSQKQSGSTAGILLAFEAPFWYPNDPFGGRNRIPIGAWFGVNMTTGSGDAVGDIGLAAGFSIAFISGEKLTSLQEGGGAGLGGSSRLLLGLIYGDMTTLGGGLQEGDPYPLGDTLPLNRERSIKFAFGLGFRF